MKALPPERAISFSGHKKTALGKREGAEKWASTTSKSRRVRLGKELKENGRSRAGDRSRGRGAGGNDLLCCVACPTGRGKFCFSLTSGLSEEWKLRLSEEAMRWVAGRADAGAPQYSTAPEDHGHIVRNGRQLRSKNLRIQFDPGNE